MYLLPNQAVKVAQQTTLSIKQSERALKLLDNDIDNLMRIYRICKLNNKTFETVINAISKSKNTGSRF